MKTVKIEEQDYEAIAKTYGDFQRFIKEAAEKARKTSSSPSPSSFLEAANKTGFFPGGSDTYPPDLSSNPEHLEGFGR